MSEREYHDSDFSMRARFYLETKGRKNVRSPRKNKTKVNASGKLRGRPKRRVK